MTMLKNDLMKFAQTRIGARIGLISGSTISINSVAVLSGVLASGLLAGMPALRTVFLRGSVQGCVWRQVDHPMLRPRDSWQPMRRRPLSRREAFMPKRGDC
jgi:hypothetical protein